MKITRRRFIAISAAVGAGALTLATPVTRWRGVAFGADVEIGVTGEKQQVELAMAAAKDTLRRLEALFSIYDPASALSRFNAGGVLTMPPEFSRLVTLCDEMHTATDGLFDPTVQALFAACTRGGGFSGLSEQQRNRLPVGWQHVFIEGNMLCASKRGLQLTFNGIAQGFAADRVYETLTAHGLVDVTVNTGEWRTKGRSRKLTVQTADGTQIGIMNVKDAAVATTSANAFQFADGSSHIMRANHLSRATPYWDTVSVQAKTAALADAASTALTLTSGPDEIAALAGRIGVTTLIARASKGTDLRWQAKA